MPFKSERQRRWMHANKPEMAKRWEDESRNPLRKRALRKKRKDGHDSRRRTE